MFRVNAFDTIGRSCEPRELRVIAGGLGAGEVVDLALVSPEDAKQMILELEQIFPAPGPVLTYQQILVGQEYSILNWGTATEDHAVLLNLDPYPIFSRVLRTVIAISDQLRPPGENLLLSVIPALRKKATYPRHFHRESHLSLEQLKIEGKSPSIYRMIIDLGLENTSEVLNVNLVPRQWLLHRDGRIKRKYSNLFQQQHIEISKVGAEGLNSVQGQITEDMLPFPETCRDLMVGRALIWLDSLFFHAPYLRKGRSVSELQEHPRSLLIINEFCSNSYRDIPWTPSVRRLLGKVVPDMD